MPLTNRGKYRVAANKLADSSEALQAILLTTAFPGISSGDLVDDGTTNDPKSYELTVSGYSRQAVLSKALFEEDTVHFVGLDCADLTFASLASGQTIGFLGIMLYSSSGGTTSDTGQDFIGWSPLTNTPTNGGNIGITIGSTTAGGLMKLASTS